MSADRGSAKKGRTTRRRATLVEGLVRVAIYVRISTDEEHQPYSLGAQLQRLEAYIASQPGWTLVRTFEDKKSGATLERDDLQRALAEARLGRFDLLLVYRVDRLSRSVRGLAHILEELDAAGVAFRSATEPFDTATPAGRMMVQMLGVFAEFERETIIDRVIAGMERKASRGEWVCGPPPFGYVLPLGRGDRKSLVPGHLIVDEDRVPLVAAIFDMYARQRLGTQAIAKWLRKNGHRTLRGKPWGHTAVLTILRNRAYLGEVFFRGKWHPAPHPPLVDADLFDKAQEMLAERGEDMAGRASNATDYLLSGLVVCDRCGKHYVGTAATGNAYRYRYYTCWSRNRYGTATCDADRLPADELDAAILGSLLRAYEPPTLFRRAFRAAASAANDERDRLTEELAAVQSEIDKAVETTERYFQAFENGSLSEVVCGERIDTIGSRLVELRSRRDELTGLLDSPPPEPPSDETLAKLRGQIAHLMENGPDPERKAVVQALVEEVRVVSRARIVPTLRVPDDHVAGKVLRRCSDSFCWSMA